MLAPKLELNIFTKKIRAAVVPTYPSGRGVNSPIASINSKHLKETSNLSKNSMPGV